MSATHTLFYAAASPFVRKVLVLLHETGQRERVALEEVTPTPATRPARFPPCACRTARCCTTAG